MLLHFSARFTALSERCAFRHPPVTFCDSPDCSCSLLFLSVALSDISGPSVWILACIYSRRLQRSVFQEGYSGFVFLSTWISCTHAPLELRTSGHASMPGCDPSQLHDLDHLPQDPCIHGCSEIVPSQFPGPERSTPPSNSSGLLPLMTECMSSGPAYIVCHR